MSSDTSGGDVKPAPDHRILAFDVRVHPTQALTDLASDYRRRALLDPKAPHPLSVDETIWPQVDAAQYEEFLHAVASAMKWPHDPSSLCDSNNLLSKIPGEWLQQRPSAIDPRAWLIALSVSRDAATYLSSLRVHGLLYEPTAGIEVLVDNGWKVIGYDAADKMLYSPLMNDALGLDENKSIADRFRPYVNEYGLFSKSGVAEDFASVAAAAIKDHSPYFAVGLWAHSSNF